MSWLRIDDGFAFHPKVGKLTRADRWTWMEVMCHCATQGTAGAIPSNITELYRYVTPRFLVKARTAGLVDVDEDGTLHIHDWDVYNAGSLTERIASFLVKNPNSSANEIHKAVGGKREIVLALVAEHKQQSQTPGSLPGSLSGSREPEGNQEGTGSGTGTKSVHARALPYPNPSLKTEEQTPPTQTLTKDVARELVARTAAALDDIPF